MGLFILPPDESVGLSLNSSARLTSINMALEVELADEASITLDKIAFEYCSFRSSVSWICWCPESLVI